MEFSGSPVVSLSWAWVQCPVRELRFCKWCAAAKKRKIACVLKITEHYWEKSKIKKDINKKYIYCVPASKDSVLFLCWFTQSIYRVNVNSIKITTGYCLVLKKIIEKMILKLAWNCKEQRIVKTTLKGKNKVEGLIQSDFKTYYRIGRMWSWHQYQIDQLKQGRESRNRLTHIWINLF